MYQRIFKDPGSEGSMSSSLNDAKKLPVSTARDKEVTSAIQQHESLL
jgi:hypothetical protein